MYLFRLWYSSPLPKLVVFYFVAQSFDTRNTFENFTASYHKRKRKKFPILNILCWIQNRSQKSALATLVRNIDKYNIYRTLDQEISFLTMCRFEKLENRLIKILMETKNILNEVKNEFGDF